MKTLRQSRESHGRREDPGKRSRIMRAVKSRDTSPERRVRSVIHRLGYRFSLRRDELPGKPDLTFPRLRSVVFVHGCFWHGHGCRRGARVPKTNVEYWTRKISRNRVRDAKIRTELRRLGWKTLILWECQLKDESAVRRRVVAFLNRDDLMVSPHGRRQVSQWRAR
ncbi:MAG: very short patch repair endonuclease [Candidatus Binataceae bacterium]